jgi:hypothetical protein
MPKNVFLTVLTEEATSVSDNLPKKRETEDWERKKEGM